MQYTSGPAKSAIKNCVLIAGEAGYEKAREILKNRFGNSHLVSQRIMSDLKNGKSVHKPHEIQQLADELSTALAALEQLDKYDEINTQQSIIDILQRCQLYIRNRWRKKALEIKKDSDLYPSFKDFVNFLKLIASEACDPIYGSENSRSYNKAKSVSCSTITSFQSPYHQKKQVYKPCVVCGQEHRLFYCESFKKMPPKARLDIAVKNKLCFNCLLAGHGSRECRKVSVCSVPGCGRKHTKFIHVESDNPESSEIVINTDAKQMVSDNAVNSHANVSANTVYSCVYLPIVQVIVNDQYVVYALLDTGSTNTFISANLAEKLNLDGTRIHYRMNTLENSSDVDSRLVSFSLKSICDDQRLLVNKAIVISNIPAKYPNLHVDQKKYPHLAELPIPQFREGLQVDVLIGMDNGHALMPLEVRSDSTGKNKPYAVRTMFGWSLNGPGQGSTNEIASHFVSLEKQVHQLWELETVDDDLLSYSQEDILVLTLWKDEVEHKDGHYVLPIPWKSDEPCFPNNKWMANMRLRNLIRKLYKEGNYEAYDEKVQIMLNKGYAEPVLPSHMPPKIGAEWYIPHHAVVSSEKVRLVFDCAAKQSGISLNNQCHQGPDLNNKLFHVLLRFRQYQYAVMADIESMYLQVRIPEKDRNFLRFLWMDEQGSVRIYRMTSHLFGGVWCASSSTFALRKTADDVTTSPLVKDTIYRSFYVDDMLKSVRTVEEANQVITETREVLQHGGFNLTKFVVNNPKLIEQIDIGNRAKEAKEISTNIQSKALGIKWDVTDDSFYYVDKHDGLSESHVTRRIMLSRLASVYDPLGLVLPVLIRGKIFFQEATRLHSSWDNKVPTSLANEWNNWLTSMNTIQDIRFPRCLIPATFDDGVAELHHFCDASSQCYGACTYIRTVNHHGLVEVTLVASKARLAPLKKTTVPRLELSSAALAIKLESVIRRELDVALLPSTFWTDSKITLAYIQNESRRFKVFVANRISVIRQNSDPSQWKHICGKENPADILSRGCEPTKLPNCWLRGPSFLRQHKDSWPIPSDGTSVNLEDDFEVIQKHSYVTSTNENEDVIHPLEKLVNHFSSYYKLKKAVCWLLRWKSFLRYQQSPNGKFITVPELQQAECLLVKYVQSKYYHKELKSVQVGQVIAKSSVLFQLSPIIKDDVLVVGGRMKHAFIGQSSKHPAILPYDHRLSSLIIQDIHGAVHLGNEWILSLLRNKFWIVKARSLIKRVRRNCFTCKKLYGKPMNQKMAHLPPERTISQNPPFSYVGIDLFGPFLVKVGRSQVKRYGCIFTCFSIRAIHIEVLHSLETDTFINGFVRFSARRGYPIKVWSDNGTNLVGAQKELSRSLHQIDYAKVVSVARRHDVEWVFNPPSASHYGGIWERMIRTIRRILMSLITPHTRLTDDVLNTLFCEVENIVNSRPITKCSDDVSDGAPLTPNHLLMLKDNASFSWCLNDSGNNYQRRWRLVQNLC